MVGGLLLENPFDEISALALLQAGLEGEEEEVSCWRLGVYGGDGRSFDQHNNARPHRPTHPPHHHQIPITKQDDEGLAALVHEGQGHISPILDALIDEENVYMVMPYFHGKDLYQKVSLCTCSCACLCVCLSVVGR